MLIGADIYWKLVSNNMKKDDESGLVAIQSSFGWLVNGPFTFNRKQNVSVNLITNHVLKVQCEVTEEKKLSNILHKFYDLDTIGIAENETSVYDESKDQIKLENSRYTVKLPFKENHPEIPDNYNLCKGRLKTLKRRLGKNSSLKIAYDAIITEQLQSGIIEECKDAGKIGAVTYLPHREVIKSDWTTTKTRVVFNASVKKGNDVSLNEILYKGPSLTPELFKLLLKFRIHPIAICADIEKAYLQINVHADHRDYSRFLFYRNIHDPNSELVLYRFTRVIFGATCSQFLLNGGVHTHASKYEDLDPEFSTKVRADFYVDDFISGTETEEKGIELYNKIKERFKQCNFNIVKWTTNDNALRKRINSKESNLGNKFVESGKILGVLWKKTIFVLIVKELLENVKNVNPTKRNVLKTIASIYDPVGYIQPLVIKLKIWFQQICSLHIDWDNYIGYELEQKWIVIVREVENFNEIAIQRCYFLVDLKDPNVKHYYKDFRIALRQRMQHVFI